MQLYINTKGTSVNKRAERFLLRVPSANDSKEKSWCSHEFSAKKIESILIGTGVQVTSDSINLAIENNIDIVFLDGTGFPTSRIWQTKLGSTAKIRRVQLEVANDLPNAPNLHRSQFVIEWLQAKTQNQIDFLAELKKRRTKTDFLSKALQSLANIHQKIQEVDSQHFETQTLLGLEGTAGRIYFDTISNLLPTEYQFKKRSRRPALDPFNAFLNYSYGVLYGQVERAIILAGLDPFIGFFHTDNYNKPSLVYDLIEPFRIIAERTTVLLFTGKRIKKAFHKESAGGIELSKEGRATLVDELNKRLDAKVRYPVQQKENQIPKERMPVNAKKQKYRLIKQRAIIRHEAHAIANRLLEKHTIPQLITTNSLKNPSDDLQPRTTRR